MNKLLKILSVLFLSGFFAIQGMGGSISLSGAEKEKQNSALLNLPSELREMIFLIHAESEVCSQLSADSIKKKIKALIKCKSVCSQLNEQLTYAEIKKILKLIPEDINDQLRYTAFKTRNEDWYGWKWYPPLFDDECCFDKSKYKNKVAYAAALIALGADPNAAELTGDTSLHFAVKNNSPELIRLLIKHNADIYRENNTTPDYPYIVGCKPFTCRDNTPIGIANKQAYYDSTSLSTILTAKYGTELATAGSLFFIFLVGVLRITAESICTIL
jgi:hypothetical protein